MRAKSASVRECAPSLTAFWGHGWTSTIRPSAPMATAARESGGTRLRLPVAWLGSRTTGRCVSSFNTGTAALAGGVARVENHRQMRELVQHRNGRDIASIAGSRFKGPYAALAENYIGVAVGHDVLGRHQQLLDGGTHAALQ